MKKISKMTALLLGTVALGFSVASLTQTPKAQDQVAEAATTQTHRRVYVYLEGGWDNNGHMFIHYWGGSTETDTTWGTLPEMTNVVPSFSGSLGLFYYDIPLEHTNFMVATYNGGSFDDKNKSVDIAVLGSGKLFDGTNFRAAAVSAWIGDGVKRTVTFKDTLTVTDVQASAILDPIGSCSTSYTSGFNALPQLMDLFITPNSLANSTYSWVDTASESPTTIAAKLTWMQQKWNIDNPAGANPFIVVTPDNKRLSNTIIILGLVSVAALGFVSIRKKA